MAEARGEQAISVTVIRKGEVAASARARFWETNAQYVIGSMPAGLAADKSILAVVIHFTENEAGYVPEERGNVSNHTEGGPQRP